MGFWGPDIAKKDQTLLILQIGVFSPPENVLANQQLSPHVTSCTLSQTNDKSEYAITTTCFPLAVCLFATFAL